jgi:serine/threonine protein kinase
VFQTNSYVFFLMDLYIGGDLFNLMQKKGRLSEDECRFFMAEVILAFDYLHEKGILYRDLKPENVMLNWQGHIKIVDFGLSKNQTDKLQITKSFVGSEGYISPEVTLRRGHNYLHDIYGLGVFMYELLHGYLPIENSNSHKDTNEERISELHRKITFKEDLSPEAKDLLGRLLCANPENRLGGEDNILCLLYHPWLKAYSKYVNSLVAPEPVYVPNLEHDNFGDSVNGELSILLKNIQGRVL